LGALLEEFKKSVITYFVGAISSNTDYYYLFTARPTPFLDDNNPPGVVPSVEESRIAPLNKLLFGKKIANTNIRPMTKRYNWQSNTIYTQYSHIDPNLPNSAFYVLTDQNLVYKCLYNNRGAISTDKPTLIQNNVFQTADSYIWKYMYSISTEDMNAYATASHMPITPNSAIVASAYTGIDVIDIIAGGNGYITTSNGFIQSTNPLNNKIIQLDNSARSDNGFYNNSTLYITNGTSVGQTRRILTYVANSSGKWATLDSFLPGIVPTQTHYEINPTVLIDGDGTSANAICQTSNGVISSIVVLNPGSNYTRATASVLANSSYGSSATLKPYISPPGGHGFDPNSELFGDCAGITVDLVQGESNTIPTECSFRTVGVMKNPRNANGSLITSNTFNQLFYCNTTPMTPIDVNNILVGRTSGAIGTVVASNTTVLILSAESKLGTGNAVHEIVDIYFSNNVSTGLNLQLNSVTQTGPVDTTTPGIVYLTNLSPAYRSNTSTETIKLIIQV
jgi:hypothetical protein